jgi:hypothetical protein
VILRDCDIDGSALSNYDVCFSTGFAGNGTVERCNIYGVGSGIAIIHAGSTVPCIIRGNYVHDLRSWGDPAGEGSHNDGFTIRDYAGSSALILNNRIDTSAVRETGVIGNNTGPFFLQPYSGVIDNVLCSGNLLEGYGYNICLERHNYDYGTHIRIVDNRFNPKSFSSVGYVLAKGLPYSWGEWSENYYYDPNKSDKKGDPAMTL